MTQPRRFLLLVMSVLLLHPFLGALAWPDKPQEDKELTNSIGMKFVPIPAGTFKMGSPKDEEDRGSDEHQYEKVMGENPSSFSKKGESKDKVKEFADTSSFPVENVSWKDAVRFCEKLTELAGERRQRRLYRLPTEAEWEYACRGEAMSSTPFHFGQSLSSRQANFDGNFPYGGAAKGSRLKRTTAVGSYQPNALGLYDMHGNVQEWCSDWYDRDYYMNSPRRDPQGPASGSGRVRRGGSWEDSAWFCRTACRWWFEPSSSPYYTLGFRVALVPSGER